MEYWNGGMPEMRRRFRLSGIPPLHSPINPGDGNEKQDWQEKGA